MIAPTKMVRVMGSRYYNNYLVGDVGSFTCLVEPCP